MLNQNVEKMKTYLKGFLNGANMTSSMSAIDFICEKFQGMTRKDGKPAIIHPLAMACYALGVGVRDDNAICVMLLHDIIEDCNVAIDDLPFNDIIKKGVKYMTIGLFPGEQKLENKRRYFNELLESREATLCKAADRYYNLSTMEGVLEEKNIIKNIVETHYFLMPILKEAQSKWISISNTIYIYRTNIMSINGTLAEVHHVELRDDYTTSPTIEEVLAPKEGK